MIINLTSAAVIIWSGMLVIAGAVIVLSSQVRHLVELLESRSTGPAPSAAAANRPRTSPGASSASRARNAGPRGGSVANARPGRRYAPARDAA